MTTYAYGMRLRPASPGAQPKGLIDIKEGGKKYYNIITYSRLLSEKEVRDYELDYLGEEERRVNHGKNIE